MVACYAASGMCISNIYGCFNRESRGGKEEDGCFNRTYYKDDAMGQRKS